MKVWILLGTALSMVTGLAQAQQVYRSVGPDGKIVYSDKPIVAIDSKAGQLDTATQYAKSGAKFDSKTGWYMPPSGSSNVFATATAERVAQMYRQQNFSDRRNQGYGDVKSLNAQQKIVDHDLEKSMFTVLGYEDMVLQTTTECAKIQAVDRKVHEAAYTNWMQRNATILAKKKRVLAEAFGASQRLFMEQNISSSNRANIEAILKAPEATQTKWCEQTVTEINRGDSDFKNKEHLTLALVNYSLPYQAPEAWQGASSTYGSNSSRYRSR